MSLLEKILPSLLAGSQMTLVVFAVTLLISFPLSLLLSAVVTLNCRPLNRFFKAYIYMERGTPLLLQLMFVYFGLPYLGLTLSRMTAIYVAFILNYTAYFMEILRGGLHAVDPGQFEAARVLGLSRPFMFRTIIIPQCLRNCLPAISNEILSLIKDTSLISVLGATELLKAGRGAVNTYASAVPFLYVGVLYLVMTFACTKVLEAVERKVDYE